MSAGLGFRGFNYYNIKFQMGFSNDLNQFRETVHRISAEGKLRQDNCTLHFVSSAADISDPPSETYVPIVESEASPTFNFKAFKADLSTSTLGRVIIHTETTRTTNDFLNGPNFLHDGIVIIADRQTQGHGRAGNIWMSPPGKNFALHLISPLPIRLSSSLALTSRRIFF